MENASYSIGTCTDYISDYPKSIITTIAVYAEKPIGKLNQPITSCGMCRKALLEADNKQNRSIKIIMIGNDYNFFVINKCAHLLPFTFDGCEL